MIYRQDEDGNMKPAGLVSLQDLSSVSPAEALKAAEHEIAALPQVELPPAHLFAEGLYARTILIPSGVALTGYVHIKGDLNILHYGRIQVIGSDGIGRTLEGPCMWAGEPGLKKLGYAITDCSWTNVWATDEKDIEKLETLLFKIPDDDEVKPQFDFSTGRIKGTLEDVNHERSHYSGSPGSRP